MKYIKSLSIMLLVVFLASCEKDNSSSTEPEALGVETGKYSPASLNSTWKYEVNQNGNKFEVFSRTTGTETHVGEEWVVTETSYNGQMDKGFVRYKDGKYYSFIPDGKTQIVGDFEFLHIDENAEEGDSWDLPTNVKFTNSSETIPTFYKITVSEKLDSYEVRGNTYDDVIVMHLNLSVEYFGQQINLANQKYYYAAEIGVIKSVIIGSGQTVTQELIEYTR